MAKKKTASPKTSSNKTVKPKTSAKKSAAISSSSSSTAVAAPPSSSKNGARPFTYDEIGNTAGEVWQVLSMQNEQTVAALKKAIAAPSDLVLAGIGWLAREEKLNIETKGRTVRISLR